MGEAPPPPPHKRQIARAVIGERPTVSKAVPRSLDLSNQKRAKGRSMGIARSGQLVLVALLCFSFVITAANGRNLLAVEARYEKNNGRARLTVPKAKAPTREADDFMWMDYSPARRKPPIHN
ncbi:hypothetical protein SAY87_016435 [Trapa incisa]|uniref:Uncharacterized protein n=1 Tax=Trapa incisa TaxID=236973 RepID=A0AAN7LA17_9MYRT|nr:hypothetical protein SAY87_016435 [Trapa incisa]